MPSVSMFAQRMRWWCDSGDLGYCWDHRWDFWQGGEVDCSSLVISVLRECGFDTGSASYTGDMREQLCAHGWKVVEPDGDPRVGDILLNDAHHVAVCVAPGVVSQASINEFGGVRGGEPGDQSGYETNTRSYYDFPWSCYLRYEDSDTDDAGEPPASWIRDVQREVTDSLSRYGQAGCSVDGVDGPETQRACAMLLQCGLNSDWGAGLDVDGIIGPATLAAIAAHPVGEGCSVSGDDVYAVKCGLTLQGWDVDLTTWDWDATCTKALAGHQSWHGLDQDGVCGAATLPTLLPLACA